LIGKFLEKYFHSGVIADPEPDASAWIMSKMLVHGEG
jgi:hypothetical protein